MSDAEPAVRRLSRLGLATLALLAASCSLWKLREDLQRLERFGMVGGTVSLSQADEAPIIVALCTGAGTEVVDTFVLNRPGTYFFTVPAGTYRLAAFVDRNRDFTYQAGKLAAWYREDVAVAGAHRVGHIDLHVVAPGVVLELPISARSLGERPTAELPPIHLGEVVTFDDPRFAPKTGSAACGSRSSSYSRSAPGSTCSSPSTRRRRPCCSSTGRVAIPATGATSSSTSTARGSSRGSRTTRPGWTSGSRHVRSRVGRRHSPRATACGV